MAESSLPTVDVSGQFTGPGSANDLLNSLGAYSQISTFAWDTLARPLNWIQTGWQSLVPPPIHTSSEELPEVVVEAPSVPLSDLTDTELKQVGTDSAYDELLYRQTGNPDADSYGEFFAPTTGGDFEPSETFAPPFPLPLPVLPVLPAVTVTGVIADALFGFAPWLLPFVPLRPGGRELDEAPRYPPRPPFPRNLTPLDPILPPNWNDLAYEPKDFGADDLPTIDVTGRPFAGPMPFPFIGDRIGRILPISDDPGLLADPLGFPELPQPLPFPSSRPGRRPAIRPRPDRTAPEPFGDPFPFVDDDPFADPRSKPRPGDRPFPYPDAKPWQDPFQLPKPEPITRPVPDLPPRIGDPISDPLPPRVFNPISDLPPDLFRNPLDAPNFVAFPWDLPQPKQSGCDCSSGDKKKKKKKKKKSKPREICYEGHYLERARGLTKRRGKRIPCN